MSDQNKRRRLAGHSSNSTNNNNNNNNNKTVMPASSDNECFDVLFYKCKNKVHKSKGVSKMDGQLKVTSTNIILMEGESTIFRGRNPELSKRVLVEQDNVVDATVMVGQYQVEILNKNNAGGKVAAPKPSLLNKPSLLPRKGLVSQRSGPLHPPKGLGGGRRAGLARKTAIPTAASTIVSSIAPPSTTSSQKQSDINSCDDDSSDNDENNLSLPNKRGPLHPQPARLRKKLPAFQKPIRNGISKKPAIASESATKSIATKTPTPATPTPATATTATATAAAGTKNYFPGAIGKLDVPHSIRSVLRPHQVEGVTFLWNTLTGNGTAAKVSPHVDNDHPCQGAILADEMGLGKTLMTIAVICAFHRQSRDMRFVVVCPSSLVANWAAEFDKWLGQASQPKRVVVKKGGPDGLSLIKAFCTVKPRQQSEVLIISYDLFRMTSASFENVKKVGLLVVDEGHRLKNTSGSLTLTALESLTCDARLCITATPIQNILSDFFNIANFACPDLLGDLATFRREYERPISASNNKSASSEQKRRGLAQSRALDEITQNFMLRRLQKDVLKSILPRREEVLLFCRPTSHQCKLYKELTKSQQSGVATGVTADALTTLISLRKLCSHPHLNDKSSHPFHESDVALSGKLTVLDSLLESIRKEAPDDKIVIVSNFTSALSVIEDAVLKPRDLTYQRLDGSTDLSNRQAIVDTFNRTSAERNFAFLLSSKAGGCGLNLIGANRLVMFDPDWNPASDIQAMARVYRQGQTKPCIIYRLFTSGTVEEVIYQRQIQKGNLATLTVDGEIPSFKGKGTGFTKEELRDCFTLKEGCDCDTKSKVGTQWPNYDGSESLLAQGCFDEPLQVLSSDKSGLLAFVHVIDQESEMVSTREITEKDAPEDIEESSEEESGFDGHDMSEASGNKNAEESSDEEYEF